MIEQRQSAPYGTVSEDILYLKFRFNPAIKLVKHDQLSSSQRSVFEGLAQDSKHFGILFSDEIPEIGVQAVDQAAASFFQSLKRAGEVRSHLSDRNKVAGLVLDGLLQVANNGQYYTGPAAYPYLFKEPLPDLTADDALTTISIKGLQFAQLINTSDPRLISRWLYSYYALPLNPFWARQFGTLDHVQDFLALQPGQKLRRLLDQHFALSHVGGWQTWNKFNQAEFVNDHKPTYKLYISPHPNDLAALLFLAAQVFVESDVSSFKLGSDAAGLLRPDKLIAYFADYTALESTAIILKNKVAAFTAHGVPFTAPFTKDGLLSWGLDPPRQEQIPGWQGIQSWRLWVANKLARAVIRARSLGSGTIEPWQFALLRLQLDQIDIHKWLPSNKYWE